TAEAMAPCAQSWSWNRSRQFCSIKGVRSGYDRGLQPPIQFQQKLRFSSQVCWRFNELMYRIWREHTKKQTDAVASAKRDSGYGLVVACQGWPKILLLLRQIDLPRRFFAGFGSKSPRSSLIRIKFKIDQVYSYRGYIVIANPPSLPT